MYAVMLSLAAVDSQGDSMESGRAIMERQTARRTQDSVSQLVESLFSSVIFAKDLAARCKDRVLQLTDDVTQTIAQDLENVLKTYMMILAASRHQHLAVMLTWMC
jgi:hypothetical protein